MTRLLSGKFKRQQGHPQVILNSLIVDNDWEQPWMFRTGCMLLNWRTLGGGTTEGREDFTEVMGSLSTLGMFSSLLHVLASKCSDNCCFWLPDTRLSALTLSILQWPMTPVSVWLHLEPSLFVALQVYTPVSSSRAGKNPRVPFTSWYMRSLSVIGIRALLEDRLQMMVGLMINCLSTSFWKSLVAAETLNEW